jgi:cyclohexanecarboxyl-CoA dehydrogenase
MPGNAPAPPATVNFELNEEQQAFAQSVRAFARRQLAARYMQDDARGDLDSRTLGEVAAMGLTGLRIPERYGGQEADAVSTGIAAEEVAAVDFNAAYLLLIPMLVAEVLTVAASERQQSELLPAIADGSVLPCFCLTEPEHGSDAAQLRVRAQREDIGWRLSGEKTSVSLGMAAQTAIVFARTSERGARGISAFYVDLDDHRVQRSPFKDLGSRAIGRATIHFDDVQVPAERLIGVEGEGFIRCMQGFEFSRAIIGLMCLACASAALEEALEHARNRQAFGKPIGVHQGVSFPLVEAATLIKGARWVCYEALWRRDAGLPHRVEANMAKWWAPKVAVDVAHQALLTLGHAGYSEELPAGQRIRDLIGLEIGDGTAQIAKLVVARELLGRQFAP